VYSSTIKITFDVFFSFFGGIFCCCFDLCFCWGRFFSTIHFIVYKKQYCLFVFVVVDDIFVVVVVDDDDVDDDDGEDDDDDNDDDDDLLTCIKIWTGHHFFLFNGDSVIFMNLAIIILVFTFTFQIVYLKYKVNRN
jgi:hypothetical protein